MNILITAAKGFVGKNLTEALKNIKDGKDKTHPELEIGELYLYDIDSTPDELDEYCMKAEFVFNLAGVNRPKEQSEFMAGNFGFASTLLDTLKKHDNTCPVMLFQARSKQALKDVTQEVSTVKAREPEKICSSTIQKKPEQRCWCIALPIYSANGTDQTITAR